MATIKDEQGLLNNFATEPKVYQATEPTSKEKSLYLLTGTLSALLVAGVVLISFVVS
ncbi:MAG: ssl1498 family light-harvesting-like protein [Xenococcaceae cyanobacterium]